MFGEVTAKIGGRIRILRFNINARYEFCKMHNITEAEAFSFFNDKLNVESMRDMAYCALRAYDLSMGNKIDYNQYTVGEWISEMEQEEFERMMMGSNDANAVSKEVKKKVRKSDT